MGLRPTPCYTGGGGAPGDEGCLTFQGLQRDPVEPGYLGQGKTISFTWSGKTTSRPPCIARAGIPPRATRGDPGETAATLHRDGAPCTCDTCGPLPIICTMIPLDRHWDSNTCSPARPARPVSRPGVPLSYAHNIPRPGGTST